jgi:antirestriction protein ArdC
MKRDLYEEVSARIVAELEHGAAPWVRPWSATAGMNTPCNAVRHAGYVQSWIGLLKHDCRAIFTACSKAQAAADYLRGLALRDQPAIAA